MSRSKAMILCFVPPGGKAKHRCWLPGCCRPRAVHDAFAVGMRKWSRAQVRTWLEVFDGGTFASSVPHDKVYKSLDGPTMSGSPMRLIREAYEDPDIVAQYQYAVDYWAHFLTLNAGTLRCAVYTVVVHQLSHAVGSPRFRQRGAVRAASSLSSVPHQTCIALRKPLFLQRMCLSVRHVVV